MSIRRDSRSPASPGVSDDRKPHTFLCRDDLYRAFEARARDLECSVDWLLAEAMKRLLADASLKPPAPRPNAAPPSLPRPPLALPLPPPPPPPRPRRPTGSFVGQRPDAIALRVGEARAIVDRDRFVLGRGARDAHFTLRDPGVSRQHAIVERAERGYVIVDMASTNGVRVNGVRITRAPIQAGDVVEIGPFAILVERA
ncbi:MAG: FHA domain-containing protein [Labilithrix sp.]|nr:FHA domain-containing protein [Labilithrix sp.]